MTATIALDIATPAAFEPLLAPARYKGAKGGRGSGKSHFFAECAVERLVTDPDHRFVCIREVQRSLRYSAKSLVERKIRDLGVSDQFTVLNTEIRRVGGTGVMIFEGMQDHTADSIKSLEGFCTAWVEEAQNLSRRSMDLLLPTIRAEGSELWFSWNPEQPTDPVDQLLVADPPPNAAVVHVIYRDNPFCPDVLREEARRMLRADPDGHAHVWLGGYNKKSKAAILAGKWEVDEFTPGADWDGPYHGADWGFATDPTVLVQCWVHGRRLYVERESYEVGLELDDTAARWMADVPGCERYTVRADSARPESISHVRRGGSGPVKRPAIPRLAGAPKWSGSVEDGIEHLRSYDRIVIHERCEHAQEEARLYSYKVDKQTGDVLPVVVDKYNHVWDAVRYALAPMIQPPPPPPSRRVGQSPRSYFVPG